MNIPRRKKRARLSLIKIAVPAWSDRRTRGIAHGVRVSPVFHPALVAFAFDDGQCAPPGGGGACIDDLHRWIEAGVRSGS
jgi:hypothetical protein